MSENKNPGMEQRSAGGNRLRRIKVIGLVILSAAFTIIYVGNVMTVNYLLKDVQQKKKNFEKLRSGNEVLNARINEMQSAWRITVIARDKLGMTSAAEAPVVLPKPE